MNDGELTRILKSADVPHPEGAFWKELPERVITEITARERASVARSRPAAQTWRNAGKRFSLKLAFGAAVGCTVLVAGLLLGLRHGAGPTGPEHQLAEAQQLFRELESIFPNQLRALILSEEGPKMVLADAPTIPRSPPLYLRVGGPKGSTSYVTFSGQQIQINGELCEVLVDLQGRVLLVGQKLVWAGGETPGRTGAYEIEGRILEDPT